MFKPFRSIGSKFYLSAMPRVVHSLPGRVRIHFPGLGRLSSHWHRYSAPVAELVEIKKGIRNTNIQPATGNVLITYDSETLGEKDILKWLESMVRIFLNDSRNYGSLSEDNFESLLKGIKLKLVELEK